MTDHADSATPPPGGASDRPPRGPEYLRETTRFEPGAVEARWTDEWLGAHLFHAAPDPARPPYSIVIPPPNITGVLHMGHALNNTIQDVLIRYHLSLIHI